VYFPGIGWVEFEPTSNQFPLERPETNNIIIDNATPDPNAAQRVAPTPLATVPAPDRFGLVVIGDTSAARQTKLYINLLITALVLLTLVLGIFITRRYSLNERLPVYLVNRYERRGNVPPRWLKRWVRWTNLSPIERAFQAVNLSLFWLGHPLPADVTSQKRAEVLIERLPSAQDQIQSLLHEYHTTIYTPRAGNITTARRAAIKILLKTWQNRVKETLQFLDTRYNQLK
jgi:hypothetical protein